MGKTDTVLGKKVAIFDWEWGRNLAPREGQKKGWFCHVVAHTWQVPKSYEFATMLSSVSDFGFIFTASLGPRASTKVESHASFTEPQGINKS